MAEEKIQKRGRSFRRRTLSYNLIVDVFIVLYIISVYIFSFNENNAISKAMAFVLMALLALYVVVKNSIIVDGLAKTLGAFTAFCFVSCLWALDMSVALSKTVTMVQVWILIVLLYNYIKKEKKTELFISIMCFAGSVFSVYTVFYIGVENYFYGLTHGARLGWGINNVNAIGMMAVSAFLLNLWYVFYEKKRIYAITAAICLLVSLGSGSRTALIGMILGTIALFILKGQSRKKIISILQCAGVLTCLYLILRLPAFAGFMDRIDAMIAGFWGSGQADSSMQTRFDMIELGLSTFANNPLGGIGINNSSVITKVYGSSSYLHNNYVELLATTGIIGTFIYYLMFFIPLFKVLKPSFKQNNYAIISVVLIFVNLVFHFGTVDYYDKVSYLYLILVWVLMAKAKGNDDEKAVKCA